MNTPDINSTVIDFFGRRCIVKSIRSMFNSDGEEVQVADLRVISKGDMLASFTAPVSMLREAA